MENVKNLLSEKHRHNFNEWFKVLEGMGYTNYYKVLNAKDYGIPQNRERIFCVSILGGGQYLFPNPKPLEKRLKDMLEDNVDEKYYLRNKMLNGFIRTNEQQRKVKGGYIFTPTRGEKIAKTITTKAGSRITDNYIQEPFVVASRGRNIENPSDRTAGKPTEQRLEINKTGCTNTITSVQKDNYVVEPKVIQIGNIVSTGNWDNPQIGRVYDTCGCSPTLNTCGGGSHEPKILENYRIRKLTAKECFRLMGVKDEQFDRLHGISNSQLYKLAGNSIVVDVLEAIFKNLLMPEQADTKGQLTLF